MDRNTKALRTLAITGAALTYCGAVIYGDIMFISVMHTAFPDGLLGTLATAGAVMTAVSAITLPLALHYWFAPGSQFLWGILFWLVDVSALALNAILAYAVATGQSDPWVMQWGSLSPATPLLAVIGWGIAFLLDPSHKLRHAQAELEADLIDIHAAQLRQAAKGQDVAATITTGAQSAAADVASKLTGHAARPSPTPARLAASTVQYNTSQPAATIGESGDSDLALPVQSANGHGPKAAKPRKP